MDLLDSLLSVFNSKSLNAVTILTIVVGTFPLRAFATAIQRGIKYQGWFVFQKPSRTVQSKEEIKVLEDLASKAKDSE